MKVCTRSPRPTASNRSPPNKRSASEPGFVEGGTPFTAGMGVQEAYTRGEGRGAGSWTVMAVRDASARAKVASRASRSSSAAASAAAARRECFLAVFSAVLSAPEALALPLAAAIFLRLSRPEPMEKVEERRAERRACAGEVCVRVREREAGGCVTRVMRRRALRYRWDV